MIELLWGKQAYPDNGLAGYPVAMSFDASEMLFSSQTLLWLAASAVAVLLLFGSIHRRRVRLTDSLRGYVDQHQDGRVASKPVEKDETPTSK